MAKVWCSTTSPAIASRVVAFLTEPKGSKLRMSAEVVVERQACRLVALK